MNYIINLLIGLFIKPFHAYSVELVLKKSIQIIDDQTLQEIVQKCNNFVSKEGAFSDRSGESDIYYSLFGVLVTEALGLSLNNNGLNSYIEKLNYSSSYQGVHQYCAAIINYKLFGPNAISKKIIKEIKKNILNQSFTVDYNLFLGILSLYIHKEYFSIYKIFRKIKIERVEKEIPCPVLSAMAIIEKASGENVRKTEQKILEFYCGNGSFRALKNSPTGDLLSTAVALYALHFINADLRLIKPECMEYIDSLYDNGSFRATALDYDTDVEYTFYGLLALGSLA